MRNLSEHPTARQLEVLNLICCGKSTKEIAAQLRIRFKTATAHRQHLMAKAGVHNVVLLFRWAIQNAYVTVETLSTCVIEETDVTQRTGSMSASRGVSPTETSEQQLQSN